MRRERRKVEKDSSFKNILYLLGTILGISIIAFIITFVTYNNTTEEINTERIADIVSNTTRKENLEQASSQISKTIEEVKEEALELEQNTTVSVFDDDDGETETPVATAETQESSQENTEEQQLAEESEEETSLTNAEVKELEFIMPVEGTVFREFAKDSLVYSNTLKEWITHTALDIEADKTTVVKAAEDGEVTAIKTDPRYGITVIIKHQDGFETRYANLLTAEYVEVGEKVTKGQTIGTVGNTASFEILDNFHLHFEMLKDNEYVDPNLYVNLH